MKHILNCILLVGVSLQWASCQNKTEKKMSREEKYEWEERMSAPLGYPAQVYRGGIGFKSLSDQLCTGADPWGTPTFGADHRADWMPRFLDITWMSYAEDTFYHIECPIDHEKLLALFRKGFETRGASGNLRHITYNGVCAGFAPGGVVVVWATGVGKQTEIGRYQGQKAVIPQSEIDGLDGHGILLFQPDYRKKTMENVKIVPKEVQEANRNKPIPFGLWDTYRIRYGWKPVFEIQNGGKMGDFDLHYMNGEWDPFFYENIVASDSDKQVFFQKPDSAAAQKLTVPRRIVFDWTDKDGVRYAGSCYLDEASALKAFKSVFGQHPDQGSAELEVRVNLPNTYFTVKLNGNGKSIFIETKELEVFKVLK